MCAAAITGGEIELEGIRIDDVRMAMEKLRDMGAEFSTAAGGAIRVRGPERLKAVDITTMPHPGFPTDLQPPFMACLAVANGVSLIRETVFENRYIHAAELNRMGACIRVAGDKAIVVGVPKLVGAPVMASDLRAGAALVLAGLASRETTVLDRVYHIDRGYENLESKLRSLGANITRKGSRDED